MFANSNLGIAWMKRCIVSALFTEHNSTHILDTSSGFEFREDPDEALSWFVYPTSNGTAFMQNSVEIGILYNIIKSLKSLTSA